jgi:sec-independent protein translocase protein TatB
MFDLGWDEMAVIAVLALVVLGPKELPNALRTVSMLMKNARKLAGEFQSGVNEIIREADLEDARKKLAEVNKNSIKDAITKTVDPTGEMKTALQEAAKADPAAEIKNAVQAPDVDPTGPALSTDPGFAIPAVTAPTEDAAVEIAAAAADAAPTLPPSATPEPLPEPESPDNTPVPERVGAVKS